MIVGQARACWIVAVTLKGEASGRATGGSRRVAGASRRGRAGRAIIGLTVQDGVCWPRPRHLGHVQMTSRRGHQIQRMLTARQLLKG